MRLALFQPDIPQNTGTVLRTAACMGVAVDVIEPCGFPFSIKAVKRSLMDYADHVEITRHASWDAFLETVGTARLVLLTTKGAVPHCDAHYQRDDILLLGRESQGVSEDVHERADLRVKIPMVEGVRSINVAIAGAMVLCEAMRQCKLFPSL